MPAIGKILIVFAAMLVLNRLRVQLGLALVIGGCALALWAGQGAVATLGSLGAAVIGAELWLMLAITALIIEFGRYMTEGQNAEDIVSATRRWGGRHGTTATLMALPAVIGLVPMPAGALFSAPFVEQAGGQSGKTPAWKSAVNYWFRHVWEYWWPLYPGVIVAMSIFEMEAWRFISAQVLFTPVAVGAGYVFLIRPHVGALSGKVDSETGDNRRVLLLMTPLLVVIVSLFVLPFCFHAAWPGLDVQTRKLLAVLAGLCGGLLLILRDERGRGTRVVFSTILKWKSLSVLLSLAGVLVFKAMLGRSGLLPLASEELVASGIPVVIAVAMLPLLAGLVTGIALGFTGVSFPLVVGLMAAPGSGLTPLATLVLAFGAGYMGMMLSPVHLCLLVTRDYFTASLGSVYREILPCVATMLVYTLAAHALLRALGW